MQFNVDCAIGIMNYIINNQKIDYDSGVYNVFYCTDFYNADIFFKMSRIVLFLVKIVQVFQGKII